MFLVNARIMKCAVVCLCLCFHLCWPFSVTIAILMVLQGVLGVDPADLELPGKPLSGCDSITKYVAQGVLRLP